MESYWISSKLKTAWVRERIFMLFGKQMKKLANILTGFYDCIHLALIFWKFSLYAI